MKTIIKLCLVVALSVVFFHYGFSQSAASASKEVTPPPSTEEIPEQYLTSEDTLGESALTRHGIQLPGSINMKIAAGDIDGAWKEFENFKQEVGKEQRAQVLEAEVMLCNRFIYEGSNYNKWAAQRGEAQQALLKEFPKWVGTYRALINPDASPIQIIEYTTKSIQYDSKENPDYLLYERRGRAYLQVGRTKEACADFEKCPNKSRIWEYESNCKK